MNDNTELIRELFARAQVTVAADRAALFQNFVNDPAVGLAVQQLLSAQKGLMDKWKIKNRLADLQQQALTIPNATVGKPYEASLDLAAWGWDDVVITGIEGLKEIGLSYDPAQHSIQGTPEQSGDAQLRIHFTVSGAEEEGAQEKKLVLIVNPDPRSLWKDLGSNRDDPHWKEDNTAAFQKLGDKNLVVASRRGRSHANAGGFRDDDFACRFFDDTGWGLITIADGAGSAKLARAGSALACRSVVDYFAANLTPAKSDEFASLLAGYTVQGEGAQKALSHFVYHLLSGAAWFAHQQLVQLAAEQSADLKDLHTTLIFTLFKKHAAGYAVLSFGVGDCPIALLHSGLSEVTLMNWLDVGEFGGGTRFLTLPEIFTSDKFSTRFRFKLVDDFDYLVLMTDGVYDAKFVVEANLDKIESWRGFMADLDGKNEEGSRVEFSPDNKDIAAQLLRWLEFWSAGNHDDRTLALVF